MEHSSNLTVEAMMLDSKASDLDKEERPEVLSLIPPYEGKTVLELGAGIGRFTGELAQKAGEVIALDFIETAIKKNESVNGHYKNVKFMCADVTSPDLKIADGSVDLIFSNWLLMYLSDKEVELLAERMLGWVKPGGYIFFRESCFHQSGDSKRKSNPTHYREPRFYTKIFQECQTRDASGNSYELSMVGCKCIGAYVKNKKNQNQICWIWQKVSLENDKDFQRFLDNVQYKSNGILRYERVFGQGYVSTGGFGGKVLITDYCRSAETPSPIFAEYIKQRGYDLHDVQAYGQMLKDAGFEDVIAEDRTDQFVQVLRRELERVEKEKEEFISDFSEEDYNDIVGGWKSKLERSLSGEQKWGLFIARHGGDRFLLDTVQTMYAPLQENSSLIVNPKSSINTISQEESAEIVKEKGNQAFKEKQWQKAIGLYSEAIKLNDNNGTYYSNRAAAYLELGSIRQAEADCDEAITLDKKNIKAYLRRGTAREMLGNFKEAIDDFSYALVLEPNNKRAALSADRLRKVFQ